MNNNNKFKYTVNKQNLFNSGMSPKRKVGNNFTFTGQSLPIYIDELEQHIYKLLYSYDKAIQKPQHNPYKHPIVHTTKEGKTIQVPTDLHLKTIQKWNAMKMKHQQIKHQQIKPQKDKKNNYTTYILIIVALILVYYVGRF